MAMALVATAIAAYIAAQTVKQLKKEINRPTHHDR